MNGATEFGAPGRSSSKYVFRGGFLPVLQSKRPILEPSAPVGSATDATRVEASDRSDPAAGSRSGLSSFTLRERMQAIRLKMGTGSTLPIGSPQSESLRSRAAEESTPAEFGGAGDEDLSRQEKFEMEAAKRYLKEKAKELEHKRINLNEREHQLQKLAESLELNRMQAKKASEAQMKEIRRRSVALERKKDLLEDAYAMLDEERETLKKEREEEKYQRQNASFYWNNP